MKYDRHDRRGDKTEKSRAHLDVILAQFAKSEVAENVYQHVHIDMTTVGGVVYFKRLGHGIKVGQLIVRQHGVQLLKSHFRLIVHQEFELARLQRLVEYREPRLEVLRRDAALGFRIEKVECGWRRMGVGKGIHDRRR